LTGQRFRLATPQQHVLTFERGDNVVTFMFVEYFHVTFVDHTGNVVYVQRVNSGNNAAAHNLAPRAGYTFQGWFTAPTGGAAFAFATTPIVANITLHARWQQNQPPGGGGGGGGWSPPQLQVSFNLQGGSGHFPTQTVAYGGTATRPTTEPTRENHIFLGWFRTPDGDTQFDFNTQITASITLFARWEHIALEAPPEVFEEPEVEVFDMNGAMPLSPYHMAYMIGYQGLVRPGDNMTRAEVATIFFRLMSDQHRVNIWSQNNLFNDVHQPSWYNNAVSTLTNGGLLMGYPDGYFRPNQAMTRAEFAALVVRVMGLGHVTGNNAFTDTNNHWAASYIYAAYVLGWVQGFGDGTFRPNQFITRAEVAALVNRATRRLPASADDLLPGMLTWADNMNQNAWYYLYIQEATNSNYFEMNADGIHKTWTGLMANREWWRLERPDSNPNIFTGAHIGADMNLR